MKRLEAALLAGLLISLAAAGLADFAGACNEVRGEVLRLHILADSDSETDQQNKLAVRDALIAQSGELFGQRSLTLAQAAQRASQNLSLLEHTARKALDGRGCTDPVQARLARVDFPTRRYGDMLFPAGNYLALQVVIGEGKGHNWWCVMYPPLCLPAASPADFEKADRLQQRPGYKMGFAAVELWERASAGLRRFLASR